MRLSDFFAVAAVSREPGESRVGVFCHSFRAVGTMRGCEGEKECKDD